MVPQWTADAAPDAFARLTAAIGPHLQGALMESIDSRYAAHLHTLPFNPYSQYCLCDARSEQLTWHINALTDQAAEYILAPLEKRNSIKLKHGGVTLNVAAKTTSELALSTLTSQLHDDPERKTHIQVLTPAAFKQSGSYRHVPSTRMLFQNLIMHYSAVFDNDKEVDPDTVDYIEQHTDITAFNIRSRYFQPAAGRKIPGFVGKLTIHARGPQTLTGFVRMLLRFGEYAGLGIKTSMGMGGMQLI
jgi:CRISPR-associated endoribonuclease Cas6